MATTYAEIEAIVRVNLNEPTPKFWTSAELRTHTKNAEKDLWRAIVDLKGEHYLTINAENVSIVAGSDELAGVPKDVHKIYNIEVADPTVGGSYARLFFTPLDWNHKLFSSARTREALDGTGGGEVFYAIMGQGTPVGAPTVKIAPVLSGDVALSFAYVPSLELTDDDNYIHIPGEADNAIAAWVTSYARAKEREDRAPDPTWLSIYGTEKKNLLESLGLRQYQEVQITDGMFSELW